MADVREMRDYVRMAMVELYDEYDLMAGRLTIKLWHD